MAVDIETSFLLKKLEDLCAKKEIVHPILRSRLHRSATLLNIFLAFLKDFESIRGRNATSCVWEAKLLHAVYFADIAIDTFLLKTMLQRQKVFIKVPHFINLWSQIGLSNEVKQFHIKLLNAAETLVCEPILRGDYDDTAKLHVSDERPNSGVMQVRPGESSGDCQLQPLENKDVGDETARPNVSDEEHALRRGRSSDYLNEETDIVGLKDEGFGDDTARSNVSNEQHVGRRERTYDYLDPETDIVVLQDKEQDLNILMFSNCSLHFLISVVGVRGSGKTTLVRKVYNSISIRQYFECRAWVLASKGFAEKDLLIDIWQQVMNIKKGERLPHDLSQTLRDLLTQKRYLIVLDDLWTLHDWEKLKSAFPNSLNGSRVILVTRDFNPEPHIDQWIFHLQLRPLTDEESWELFLKMVRKVDKSNTELIYLKEKILQKCCGLPLAIVGLAGLLSTKELGIWSKVIENIEQEGGEINEEKLRKIGQDIEEMKRSINHTKRRKGEGKMETTKNKKKEKKRVDEDTSLNMEEEEKVMEHNKQKVGEEEKVTEGLTSLGSTSLKIWDLVYAELPTRIKPCLLYMGLFPKSYEIPIRRLYLLWLAEGLVTPFHKEGLETSSDNDRKAPEELVDECFEQLRGRNMIEVAKWRSDGRPKACRVPSTLYDTLFLNVEETGFFHVHRNLDYESKPPEFNIHRLAQHFDIKNNPPSDQCIQNLRSYLSFNTRKGDTPADEVGKLINRIVGKRGFGLLRVLDLEHVYKPVLSETLGKLILLRYLGLRWTFLDLIPESVGDLPHLETLDVKHTNITTLPTSIWKAKNLRHLYMNNIHFDMSIRKPSAGKSLTNLQTLWGLLIGIKSPPDNLLQGLIGLRKLGLTCHTASMGVIKEWISRLTNLQSLRLRSINEFYQPSDLTLGTLEKQEKLSDLSLLGKLQKAIVVSGLPQNLKILTLSASQLTEDPMPMLGKLKGLNILRLFAHSYVGKQMLCRNEEFPQLCVLKLWMLEELEKWTVEKGAMPALRELEIRCCKNLQKADWLENVTTLKKLTLTNMKQEFVADVEGRMRRRNLLIEIENNNWKFNPSWE